VRGDAVIVVSRDADAEADASLDAVIDWVEAGPLSDPETASGLLSEVPAGSVRDVELRGGVATVSLTRGFADMQADAQLLAVGQLVCTLTARPGVGQVRFTLDGADIDVPRQDGSLTAEPVTRDDYRDLIAGG
jgi:spore germination protein GerM